MKTTAATLLTFFLMAPLFGQGALPAGGGTPFGAPAAPQPAPRAQPPPPPQVNNNGTAGNYSSSTVENSGDKLFDVNSDSIDFENGSFQWKGRTFNLGNSRFMRARLERYLAAPAPDDDLVKYVKLLDKIEGLMSPRKLTPENYHKNQQEAWDLLFEAAEYDADAENCLTIATLVDKTLRARTEYGDLRIRKNQLEQLRDYQEGNTASKARTIEVANDAASDRANQGTRQRPRTYRARQEGQTDLKLNEKATTRTEVELIRTEAEMASSQTLAKIEFQSQIVAFLIQRRFQHAIIASSFYRQIFKGGQQGLKVGEKQIKEMFPVSDLVPTIDSIDMLAREAINDVDVGMKTVVALYDSGDRFAAFERLQETFFLGEYMTPVLFFDVGKKQTLTDIWRNLRDLQRMGDERDLAGVQDAVNKVKAVAQDFPAVQIMSRVNNAIQTSNLAILSAKQAALMGDMEKAETQLAKATALWPTNPGIMDFANTVVNKLDLLAQKLPEFDRLYQAGKSRDIYNRKEEFSMALMQDPVRIEQLKKICENVAMLDGYLLQAKVLAGQGNNYTAWDILEEAVKIGGNDSELARARSEMAPQVANYSRSIATAENHERAGNLSAALTEYLSAHDLNPTSDFCQKKIQSLSARLLEQTFVPTVTTAAY